MNRFPRAHATHLAVAQAARKTMRGDDHAFATTGGTRWVQAGNLSFADVPVRQPGQRSTSGGVESRHAEPTQQGPIPGGYPRHLAWRGPANPEAGVAPGPLTLILPFPPTVNHSSMPNANGGRYLTEDHKSFRSAVAWIVKQRRLARITGRLRVLIELYPANNRRWDIDNRCKAVLDALQHAGLFADDECIDDLRITRQIAGNEAWCRVTVAVA